MIKITAAAGEIRCITPYHPEFPSAARSLGGKWAAPKWVFDPRDEQRVRDVCMDIWGTDGTPCELVTLRVRAGNNMFEQVGTDLDLYMAGRMVAKLIATTSRIRLGDGVVITDGAFICSGSRRSPRVSWDDGTTFELRDVPLAAAEIVRARRPERIEIIGSPLSPAVTDVQVSPERQALIDERASLLLRLAAIDVALAAVPATGPAQIVYEVAHELRDAD